MSMVTLPDVVSFAFAKSSSTTNTSVTARKASIAIKITFIVLFTLYKGYNFIPENIMKARPIKPVIINAIPGPLSAGEMWE